MTTRRSVGSGGAPASGRLSRASQTQEVQGREVALAVTRWSARIPACRTTPPAEHPQLVDARPLPAITHVLPALGAPPGPGRVVARAEQDIHGVTHVLRDSVRRLRFAGDLDMIVYVAQGDGDVLGTVIDPVGCRAARRAEAERRTVGRPVTVRAWALRRLEEDRASEPGLQTLWVMTGRRGGSGSGGSGLPISPTGSVPVGLVSSSSDGTYAGIAGERGHCARC